MSQAKVAVLIPSVKYSIYRRCFRALGTLTTIRRLSVIAVGLLAFAGSATVSWISGFPEPNKHDEFAYLLAADTFAQGRLTNPTHPMWVHFESIHIIHQPTYMSKYPPGQGAILALGQFLTGHPIVGVWLSMGLMCSAISWMLFAWLPPRIAIIGALLALLHPVLGISGIWAQSYWGGALAATGGAFVLGGVRNLFKKTQIHHSLLTAFGLIILSHTRPYEGLLLSACAGWILFFGLFRTGEFATGLLLKKITLPIALVCMLNFMWMGYYNYRLTGNLFLLPYHVHEGAYGVVPLFVWQAPKITPPIYRHARLEEFHLRFELPIYNEKRSLTGFITVNLREWSLYLVLAGHVFVIPLIVRLRSLVLWIASNHWARLALGTYLFVTFGLSLETYSYLHYWAPIVPLNYYFIAQAISIWRRQSQRFGALVMPGVFGSLAILLIVFILQRQLAELKLLSPHLQRANLLARLERQSGNHLIIVRYGPQQSYLHEWVYNRADIDRAKIVWARDMDPTANCNLANYFKERQIWLLVIEQDRDPVKLSPFPRHSCQ